MPGVGPRLSRSPHLQPLRHPPLRRESHAWPRCYNRRVTQPLNADTSPDIERRQVESWRQMSPAQKAALVTGLTRAAYAMTFAGVRQRYPDASPREQFLRVAVIVLGPDLARLAYPDAAQVIPR